jgi:hypothetical protein
MNGDGLAGDSFGATSENGISRRQKQATANKKGQRNESFDLRFSGQPL